MLGMLRQWPKWLDAQPPGSPALSALPCPARLGHNTLQFAQNSPHPVLCFQQRLQGGEYMAPSDSGETGPRWGSALVTELLRNCEGASLRDKIQGSLDRWRRLHEAAGDRLHSLRNHRRVSAGGREGGTA